jgi:uncharacterized protein YrrD
MAMKKTQEIIGLPIITICDAMEAGTVKGVIVNAEKGSIDYIVVDNGVQTLGAGVIASEDILGIGEYALTIEDDKVINDIGRVPAAIELVQKDIQIKNTKVMTKKGRLIGSTGDFYVDEDNACRIVGLEFFSDKYTENPKIIQRLSVITFGKNLIITNDDVEGLLIDNAEHIVDGVIGVEDFGNTYINLNAEADTTESEAAVETEVIGDIPGGAEPSEAASLFEQKQRQYLNGKKATKTIYDNDGNIIIDEGMEITDEIIDEAKSKGKLIELVMNNKV